MYKLVLPNFEGPFDLLLYFIKRDELNIYDIPIAKITSEFLNYIRLMNYFDLELAGEFILMASTLIYIKAQMLIPRPGRGDDGELEDPRTKLIQPLLEYKQMKEASSNMGYLYDNQKYTYYRNLFNAEQEELASTNNFKNATLFDLLKAFKKATERSKPVEQQHIVEIVPITTEEKSRIILEILKQKKQISFFEITSNQNRQNIVVIFLALLEMIKLQTIVILQDNTFDDIIISIKEDLTIFNEVEQNG